MFCQNCGREVARDAKFCPQCGNLAQEVAATAEAVDLSSGTSSNEYVEKGKELSKAYRQFFVESLKAPSLKGEKADRGQLVNGCINLFFLSLFAGLGMYFQLKQFDFGFGVFQASVSFKTFFTVFLYIMAASVFSAVVLFGITRVLMKVEVAFQTVLARFSVLLTIPTALSTLYFLVSLPGMITLGMLFSLFILAGFQVAAMVTLYSFRNQSRGNLDPLICLLIFYAVFYFFFWLTRGILPSMFFGSLLG